MVLTLYFNSGLSCLPITTVGQVGIRKQNTVKIVVINENFMLHNIPQGPHTNSTDFKLVL